MPESSPSLHLVLVVHAHQPAGNFEHVFEECYKKSYDAFLSLLEKHPGIHVGLHYSGPLLLRSTAQAHVLARRTPVFIDLVVLSPGNTWA